ncbi:MAG: hypothetical protein BWY72_00754 [Bacteroidetes bacterium ADurb.Bin416]|jgi:CRISPR-associated protein Csm2|nr:MAG: hypothetical protein BWY72_00754 [Bacteroidetes bacterium ADurb.Bin416]
MNANDFFKTLNFKESWITGKADPEMVAFAEKAGRFMAENNLTNSKIRNIYGEIKRIQMSDFEVSKPSFYLLKPKVAYALGREIQKNKFQAEGLTLFKLIFDRVFAHVTDNQTYSNFCNLIEAILAYHKASGGKD